MPSIGTHDYQPAREIVVTTTGNIDDLDPDGASLIIMNNSSLSTIRGIKTGYAGKRISIVSIGAGNVELAHQNINSSASNRLINLLTSTNTLLVAGTGWASYIYDATTLKWRLLDYSQGDWIEVPYNAGNFTGNTGTWTVDLADQIAFKYKITRLSMKIQFNFQFTDVQNTGDFLRATIPGGYTIGGTGTITGLIRSADAGAATVMGFSRATAGTTYIEFRSSLSGAGYTATTGDNTAVIGEVEFEIQP